jgi:hypothetical protein
MANFKRQMIALSCCHMQLGYRSAAGVGQIDTRPVSRFSAWLSDDDNQRGLWPGELELSQPFFDSLTEHAVPLAGEAIGRLQHSALALDVYSWLAHRLYRIVSTGQALSWAAIKGQFGQEFSEMRDFRRTFLEALKKVQAVYPDARIEPMRGGLKLLSSPPPCRRERVVVALPASAAAKRPSRAGRTAPAPHLDATPRPPVALSALVSERALQQVTDLAPGWDKHYLEAVYKDWVAGKGDMPRHADAAFLGWVRKYTKGKRP